MKLQKATVPDADGRNLDAADTALAVNRKRDRLAPDFAPHGVGRVLRDAAQTKPDRPLLVETKTEELENTALFKWMKEHCAEYGFILRYPDGKQDVTGIMYEPWHFRYVGSRTAREHRTAQMRKAC